MRRAIDAAALCLLLGLVTPAPAQFVPIDPNAAKSTTYYYGREPISSPVYPPSKQTPTLIQTSGPANPAPKLPVAKTPAAPPLPLPAQAVKEYSILPVPPVPPSPFKPGSVVGATPTAPKPVGSSPAPSIWQSGPGQSPVVMQPKDKTPVQPIKAQGFGGAKDDGGNKSFKIQFEPPGPERLFRLESDEHWKERRRQEAKTDEKLDRIVFPDEVILSKELYAGRNFIPMQEVVEPSFVCYKRTYFDQINFERYGWDLGPVTPLVSAGKFYWDVLWLPYNMGTEPLRHYDSNAGYCLPGDPVPLLLYPPHLSATGLATQAAVVSGALVVFP